MGSASKFVSVVFRIMELISAAIVAGILGTYLHYISEAGIGNNGRIVYSIVIAGISIFFSLVLMPPLRYSFFAFPFDFAMFVSWMVAFGLLINLVGSGGCDSYWLWSNWGWAWGGWYRVVPISAVTPALVGTSSCGRWRATVAWSFIGGFFWLLSFILGIYVLSRDRHDDQKNATEIKSSREESHMASGVENTQGPAVVAPNQQDIACRQCGGPVRFGSKFCNYCGSQQAPMETV